MAGNVSAIKLGDVIDHGVKNNVSPEGVATAVQEWKKAQTNWLREQKADDDTYLKGVDYLDQESNKALGELRKSAVQAWRQNTLPKILPDATHQEWFVKQMQENPPSPDMLDVWQVPEGGDPAKFIEAYRDYGKTTANNVFHSGKLADWQPITSGSGAELAKWRGYKTDKGTEVSVQLPGQKESLLVLPEVTPEDYEDSLIEARDKTEALEAEEETSRRAGIDGPVGSLVSGMRETLLVQREARDARNRYELLKENPKAGEIMLSQENLTKALKNSPLADKIGKDDLLEDFTRGLWGSLVDMRIAFNDLTGDETEREALRHYLADYKKKNPGSTRRELKGGFGDVFRQGVEGLGGALPAIATSTGLGAAVKGASLLANAGIRAAGLSPLAAQSYGANIDAILSDADNAEKSGDLNLARTLRENARTFAAYGAATDVGTEMIFLEHDLLAGAGRGIVKRTLESSGQNFIEEAAAQAIQGQLIQPGLQGRQGTAQDILDAGVAGIIAAAPIGAVGGLFSKSGVEQTLEKLEADPSTQSTAQALVEIVTEDTPVIPDSSTAIFETAAPIEISLDSPEISEEEYSPSLDEQTDKLTEGERRRLELSALPEEDNFIEVSSPLEEPVSESTRPPSEEEISPEILAHNEELRRPRTLKERMANEYDQRADNNILFRPDRLYRVLSDDAWADAQEIGHFRPNPSPTAKGYTRLYASEGAAGARYRGRYILEIDPSRSGEWENSSSESKGYQSATIGSVKLGDGVRVYEQQPDGAYTVVYDKIGDRALLPSTPSPVTPSEQTVSGISKAVGANPTVGNIAETFKSKQKEVSSEKPVRPVRPVKSSGVSFKTKRGGSIYTVFEDGTTERIKGASGGIHAGDVGKKERSHKTFYVTPEIAEVLGGIYAEGVPENPDGSGKIIKPTFSLKDDGTVVFESPRGRNKDGTLKIAKREFPTSNAPEVGLHPVELWPKSRHIGTEITEVDSPETGTTEPVDQGKLNDAYKSVSKKEGFADVLVSNVLKKSGLSKEELHQKLIQMSREGKAILSLGDPSWASAEDIASGVPLGDSNYLRVRFTPEAFKDVTEVKSTTSAEETPPVEKSTLSSVYSKISKKEGFQDVLISNILKESNIPKEQLHQELRKLSREGKAVLSLGDPSFASQEARDASLDINGDNYMRVRFLPGAFDKPSSTDTTPVTKPGDRPGDSSNASTSLEQPVTSRPESGGTSGRSTETPQQAVDRINKVKGSKLTLAEAPNTRLAKFAAEVGKLTGKEILFVKGKSSFDGVDAGKYLVVRTNSPQAIPKLAGHELAHTLEKTPGYAKVVAALKEQHPKKFQSYTKSLKDLGYNTTQIQNEFVADVIGESLNDRSFWRSLTQELPANTLEKFQDATLGTLDRLTQLWKGRDNKRASATPAIRNLEETRDLIRDLLKGETSESAQESSPPEESQESRSRTQIAGVKVGTHESVSQENLHRISDPILNPSRITEASYEKFLEVAKSLRRSNGRVRTEIKEGVRKQFAERLKETPANQREVEALVLEAQAVQTLLGNALAVAAEFNSRKGKKNPKRAAAITSEVKKLVFENITQVPGDAHTAARILRSSQLQGGDLAALMHDLFDATNRFMEQQTGVKAKAVKDVETAIEEARPEATRRAALSVTVGGENYLKAESRQKSKIATFLQRFIRQESRSQEGEEGPSLEARLKSALERLEKDYAGNIDMVLELAKEAVDTLPVEQREAALKELMELTEQDIQLAEEARKLTNDSRNLNRVVKSFIKRTTGVPKPRTKLQSTADLAAWRQAVREGKMTPEEAADAFVEEGGDAALKSDLIQALEEDALSKIQEDELKEDAKRAREEYRKILKEGNKRARVTLSTDKLERIAQKAAKRASDALIEQIGKEVARSEDFQKRLEGVAERAAIEASNELMKEVGEDTARAEDFQKKLEEMAEQAAIEESQRLIKEVGDAVAREEAFRKRLEEEAAKGEREESKRLVKEVGDEIARAEDFQKRLIEMARKAEEAEIASAERIFTSRETKPPAGEKRNTLTQDILEAIEQNPEWDVSDHADKLEIIKDVLRRRGVDDRLLDSTAAKAVGAFEEHLVKMSQKAGEALLKQVKRGKVTEAGLYRAVRLNILDPSKSLTESIAALAGWNGLTQAEQNELYELTRKARDIQNQQVRTSLLLKQMRVIYRATGIPPEFRDFVSSATRSSAYAGMGTIWINATVPAIQLLTNPIRETIANFATNPTKPVAAVTDTIKALWASVKTGLRAGKLAAMTNATTGLSPARASGDKITASDTGVLAIDALERRMDLAIARIKDSKMPAYRKAWEATVVAYSFSGKMLWRIIGMFDSFATASISEFVTQMRLMREMRRADLDPVAEWDAFMEGHEAATRHAVGNLGLDPNQAALEAMTRMQSAYFADLQGRTDLRPFEYRNDAAREALSIIGNHSERQGYLTKVGGGLADAMGHRNWMGLGFILAGAPIRTVANIAEYVSWYAPGISLAKLFKEYRARKAAEDGIGFYHLHAGSNWQFRRRMYESVFGHLVTAGLIALLAAQPDNEDEKWFGITTSYPWKIQDQVRFKNDRLSPFTIYLGAGKDRKYLQFTRGVLEMLSFPAIAAKNLDEMRRGKVTPLEAGYRSTYDAVSLGLPVLDSLSKSYNLLRTGNEDKILEDFARRASLFAPATALFRSAQKLVQDAPAKNSQNYLASILVPGYALFKNDGDVELRNALDEPIYADDSVWGKLNKSGMPFGLLPTSAPKDELLAKDFSKLNYPIPPAPAFKTFQKQIAGREADLFQDNGVDSDNALYNKWLSARAVAFKFIYRNDSDPGVNAKDQRTLEEIIEARDYEGYKERMGKLWFKATQETNREMRIKEEED